MASLILECFQDQFFGYGTLTPKGIWLIGLEEKVDPTQVQTRVSTWDNMGRGIVLDMRDFSLKTGIPNLARLFSIPRPGRQPTWDRLTRCLLVYSGCLPLSSHIVRSYRTRLLGDSFCTDPLYYPHCLLELLPLALESASSKSRKQIALKRAKVLNCLVQDYRPKVVVIYFQKMRGALQELVGMNHPIWNNAQVKHPISGNSHSYSLYSNGNTKFILTDRHPAARKKNQDEYFETLGLLL